jgi:tetratricopeptide (TPR) repeat protein
MRALIAGSFVFVACGLFAAAAPQEQRPKGVPFYTWVREDLFAGWMADDMTRFERSMQKTQEYLKEDANNMDGVNWLGAGTVFRAVRAFEAGDEAKGDQLFRDAMAMMDKAAAAEPNNPGIRATAGGTLMFFAAKLPDRHYQNAVAKAREHYAILYKAQEPMLDKFPLHLKGEALAGVAETEFRAGNRDTAIAYLQKIVSGMPNTRYAQIADAWVKSPESVTKTDRLVCQSCHEQDGSPRG